MNKWGVRLIALLLLITAIAGAYELTTGASFRSFFGISVAQHGEKLIFPAWLEIFVLLYAGIQLLLFHQSGRAWGLFALWIWMLSKAIDLIRLIVDYVGKKVYFTGPEWLGESNRIIFVTFIYFGVMLYYLIPIYYLMRKDVKQLFYKADTIETSTPNSNATPS